MTDNAPITRMAPHNVEAEESLLGSILIDPDCIKSAVSIVQASDFFITKHAWVYTATCDLYTRGMPIDYLTLCDALDKRSQLVEIGGTPFVSHLLGVVPTALHAYAYAKLVVDAAVRRGLLGAASDIAAMAYDEDGDTESQRAKAMRLVADVRGGRSTTRTIAQVAGDLYDKISDWSNSPLLPGQVRGLSTGFRSVDLLLGGLEGGLLYILAGRPGMGKSALAFQIGHQIAKQCKHVAIFSLEMNAQQVLSRLVCADAKITWDTIKRGNVSSDSWHILIQEISKTSNLKMTVDDSSRMTTAAIDSTLAKLGDVDFAIVDHLGLLNDCVIRGENETLRLGRISWALKQIAKDYRIPVLSVCQLNRNVDGRDNKRPVLADLRQSGNIEENADVVLMMYRDEYYKPDTSTPGVTEIWPRKLREGDSSSLAELYFEKRYVTFADLERREL